jgi:hypothetical protein
LGESPGVGVSAFHGCRVTPDAKASSPENLILNYIFNDRSWTAGPPAVALSRADRGEEDSSTDEPNSGSGYARMKPAAADWSAVNGSAHNANVISFGTATGGAEV